MGIIYDPAKREAVLRERGLDIADAGEIFEAFHLTRADEKHSRTEDRLTSVGMMGDQLVIVVWTWRDDDRRIVTMWKANEKERDIYRRERDRSG
jgi:uncharacterized protein